MDQRFAMEDRFLLKSESEYQKLRDVYVTVNVIHSCYITLFSSESILRTYLGW